MKLNKIGENNDPLEGAEFGLFSKSDDILIQTVISDKYGDVKFTDIEVGDYYVKEIKAPKGYELSNEVYDVVIESGKANKIDLKEVVNKIIKGNALLYKVDDQNNPLQGAVFGVYKEDGTKISEVISDKDGKVEVLDLYPGRYYLQEISAPEGYELDNNSRYEFEIVLGSKDTVLIQEDPVVNTFNGGQAKLLKLHDGNKALEGAEFGVYREESNELVKVIISDKDGIIEIKGLAAGKYYFKEMKAPEGYEIDENKYPFEIKIGEMSVVDGGESINVFNGGSVKLKKVDTLGNVLEGAIFELYKDNNGSWDKQQGTYISDKDGIVEVKGLKVGKYYLKEVKSPDGYLLSDKQYPFEIIRGNNITIDLGNVENIFVNGSVKLEKVDEENKPLNGALFGLYNASNSLIKEVESDENGIVKVTDLAPGDYYLKEIKSPEGYKLDETKYNFTIISGENETVYAGKHVNVFNGGSAELLKVDEKNNVLEGAEFTLYKKVNGIGKSKKESILLIKKD
ncbi:MSCRAMM family protein [Clostridium baratii]|uniref:MSCRAMM family protein n=1 Tax=Clostridium baratii TaxID=1561 RepID=UPI003BB00352